jgi:hypothetical protein
VHRFVARGELYMLGLLSGGICSWGIPIASCSAELMSKSSRNFWENCERWVWPGCIAMICVARLYCHTPCTIWELFGGTHSPQMTGTFVQGVVLNYEVVVVVDPVELALFQDVDCCCLVHVVDVVLLLGAFLLSL